MIIVSESCVWKNKTIIFLMSNSYLVWSWGCISWFSFRHPKSIFPLSSVSSHRSSSILLREIASSGQRRWQHSTQQHNNILMDVSSKRIWSAFIDILQQNSSWSMEEISWSLCGSLPLPWKIYAAFSTFVQIVHDPGALSTAPILYKLSLIPPMKFTRNCSHFNGVDHHFTFSSF